MKDHDGTPLAQVLAARGLDLLRLPEAVRRPGELKAFVEVHIEQCFVLEQAGHSDRCRGGHRRADPA